MLHILFLILKIIGIILAVILGILVLLICTVLFVPISYQGSAKCDGTLESICGIFKITWLFNLLQVNVKYENGNMKYSVRIAWKRITGGKVHEKTEIQVQEDTRVQKETVNELSSTEQVSDQKIEKMVEEPKENKESTEEEIRERSVISDKSEEEVKKKSSLIDKIRNTIDNLKKKVLSLCNKIKCTTKNICDKLKLLLDKKEKIMQFIQDKDHIKAFLKLKKEALKLLKRLYPKQFAVKAKYGFEDPSLTGKILAVLSVIYPFAEEHMEIVPDFENKILQGRMMIKGRIYIVCFVCTAWNLIWCKQIRLLYKDIRNFKL